MEFLLAIGVAMFAGLLLSRVTSRLNLPDVTSYLVAGLLVGPLVLGRLGVPGLGFKSFHFVEEMGLICDAALGFIAFSIGSEFRLEELKKTGKQAFVIGIFQALVATLFVDLALYAVHMAMPDKLSVPQLIVLGAIATATAPAATLMVVRQYKANGPLTKLLLPIVALDDAVGLLLFAISFGVAKSIGTVNIIPVLGKDKSPTVL